MRANLAPRLTVRATLAPLVLVAARIRRRPIRWVLPVVGVAVAAAFAGSIAAEAVIAGDRSARDAFAALSPSDRTVRVTWQGVVTPAVRSQARRLLGGLVGGPQTGVTLFNPVRLSGIVVRPAAIAPLSAWTTTPQPGPCRPESCPVLVATAGTPRRPLVAAPGAPRRTLAAPGVHLTPVGAVRLASAVPLGFAPTAQPPVLLTGDVAGLDALPGLGGVYRSRSWLTPLDVAALHSWQLSSLEDRLQQVQAQLTASSSRFSLTAPFEGLDQARAEARAAPRRLLLVGGGALAALALFVVLAGGGLRREQRAELDRLRAAGATSGQCAVFAIGESAWLGGAGLLGGAGIAVAASAILASAAGLPASGVLTHSLLTPAAGIALAGGWLAATALLSLSLLGAGTRGAGVPVADVLAVAAVAALAVALPLADTAGDALAVLLAPLCCLAAGVVTFRGAAVLLRAGERLARGGPVTARLALVGLARAPGPPSLAIAFVAVSVGLAGFALSYRATLLRGTSDQAADRVPLDLTVSPGPDFRTPLQAVPLRRWQALASGPVLPVRRTDAQYPSGGGSVTVPALGLPARGLPLIHGWRAGDGSAPLSVLAGRLRPPGPAADPGPRIARRAISVRGASSSTFAVSVTADLRDASGAIRQVPLGQAGQRATTLTARVPPGRWTLQALELDEPTGLDITTAHQNGESATGSPQLGTTVRLGALVPRGWRAVGAAGSAGGGTIRFEATGRPGIVRPPQPSDFRPVPVLVDPRTAAAAATDRRLALTVDDLPVAAQVVGIMRRFPTIQAGAAGFVVADEATLASALDAQLPGQGRPDELWIATKRAQPLRAALKQTQLDATFRADVENALRSDPTAGGVLGALVAAGALCAALALIGLLTSLLGAARDERVERDLVAQGLGPRAIRAELRARLLLAGLLGLAVGLLVTALLTRLAVTGVRAALTTAAPQPSLVTVVPVAELAVLALAAIAALLATSRAVR